MNKHIYNVMFRTFDLVILAFSSCSRANLSRLFVSNSNSSLASSRDLLRALRCSSSSLSRDLLRSSASSVLARSSLSEAVRGRNPYRSGTVGLYSRVSVTVGLHSKVSVTADLYRKGLVRAGLYDDDGLFIDVTDNGR